MASARLLSEENRQRMRIPRPPPRISSQPPIRANGAPPLRSQLPIRSPPLAARRRCRDHSLKQLAACRQPPAQAFRAAGCALAVLGHASRAAGCLSAVPGPRARAATCLSDLSVPAESYVPFWLRLEAKIVDARRFRTAMSLRGAVTLRVAWAVERCPQPANWYRFRA